MDRDELDRDALFRLFPWWGFYQVAGGDRFRGEVRIASVIRNCNKAHGTIRKAR